MRRLKKFSQNRLEVLLTLAFTAMTCLHVYQFIDSGYRIYPLIRIIAYVVAIPCMIFIGEKSLPYTFFPFAIALTQTISFDNYTPFVLVYVCARMKKRYDIPMYVIYFISIVVVCMRHGKDLVHFLIHIMGCIVLYVFLALFNQVMKRQTKLNLTDDEEYILYEIIYNNRQLKDFDQWKQNTVSKKLKNCCRKNNCENPKELMDKYKRGINRKYSPKE